RMVLSAAQIASNALASFLPTSFSQSAALALAVSTAIVSSEPKAAMSLVDFGSAAHSRPPLTSSAAAARARRPCRTCIVLPPGMIGWMTCCPRLTLARPEALPVIPEQLLDERLHFTVLERIIRVVHECLH